MDLANLLEGRSATMLILPRARRDVKVIHMKSQVSDCEVVFKPGQNMTVWQALQGGSICESCEQSAYGNQLSERLSAAQF